MFGDGTMDGSTIVIPSAAAPSGLAREDALFRIVYYGEALRAITEHVNDTLIAGACGPMIEMLDEAFDTMSETRDTFGPEEFTLFVMSRMLGRCDTPDEAREFQVGAASYILKSAEALPDAYQPVVADARRMLGGSDTPAVTSDAAPAKIPVADDTGAVQTTPPVEDQGGPVPTAAARATPAPTDDTPSLEKQHYRRLARLRVRRAWKLVKRAAFLTLVAAATGIIALVATGNLDPGDIIRVLRSLASMILR
jgi:hypothetical protein